MLLAWLSGAEAGAIALILLLAILADAVAGDPPWLYRALPHPVVALGKAIEGWERRLNRDGLDGGERFRNGLGLTVAVAGLAAAVGLLLQLVTDLLPLGWLLAALLASTLLSGRGLEEAVTAVAEALETGLESGRAAVSKIVGRDPESLDEAGVARAATESLAENFSDGLVAPAFWFLVAGLPGIAAYKAINTLDSMIGHRSPR
ncbi:MAG: CobD/CbiB family cobalamin biosynthesis protein, partial [Kiloniellales bacterium]